MNKISNYLNGCLLARCCPNAGANSDRKWRKIRQGIPNCFTKPSGIKKSKKNPLKNVRDKEGKIIMQEKGPTRMTMMDLLGASNDKPSSTNHSKNRKKNKRKRRKI